MAAFTTWKANNAALAASCGIAEAAPEFVDDDGVMTGRALSNHTWSAELLAQLHASGVEVHAGGIDGPIYPWAE
jgi:hypothetical protein